MKRATSAVDVKLRWLREYQHARNCQRGLVRIQTLAVSTAFYFMPARMVGRAGRFYTRCGLVDCREGRWTMAVRWPAVRREMIALAAHRAAIRELGGSNCIPVPR